MHFSAFERSLIKKFPGEHTPGFPQLTQLYLFVFQAPPPPPPPLENLLCRPCPSGPGLQSCTWICLALMDVRCWSTEISLCQTQMKFDSKACFWWCFPSAEVAAFCTLTLRSQCYCCSVAR